MNTAFECANCGHCCTGKGGIVVSPKDLARLCAHLGMGAEAFEERFGERKGHKLVVRLGPDGACIFFSQEKRCGVHEAKPDICRAWPYFRGNLVDEESFVMAKDFCPGLKVEASFAEFVDEGLDYLAVNGLVGRGGATEARALQVDDLLTAVAGKKKKA